MSVRRIFQSLVRSRPVTKAAAMLNALDEDALRNASQVQTPPSPMYYSAMFHISEAVALVGFSFLILIDLVLQSFDLEGPLLRTLGGCIIAALVIPVLYFNFKGRNELSSDLRRDGGANLGREFVYYLVLLIAMSVLSMWRHMSR